MSSKPKIIIFEPSCGGHHFMYVGALCKALLDINLTATIVTSITATKSDIFRQWYAEYGRLFSVDTDIVQEYQEGPPGLALLLTLLPKIVRKTRPDVVFVTTADGFSEAAAITKWAGTFGLLKCTWFGGVIHRVKAAYWSPSLPQRIKRRLIAKLHSISIWNKVFVVDLLAYEYLTSKSNSKKSTIELLPDPVEAPSALSKVESRKLLDIPIDGRLVGCVGRMSSDKGIDKLIDGFCAADLAPNDRLFLVGKFSSEVKRIIETAITKQVHSNRIIFRDEEVSLAFLYQALQAMDLVCLPYVNHPAISSVLLRAASAQRPVLTPPGGWMERIVNLFELGFVARLDSVTSISEALPRFLNLAQRYKPSLKAESLLKFHTPENFGAHLTQSLAQKLGVPQRTLPYRWSEVLKSF